MNLPSFFKKFFLNNTLYAVRSISGKSVPIYTLQSGGSTGILFLFSPEHLGGNGDLEEKLKKITTEDEEQRKKETIEVNSTCIKSGCDLVLTVIDLSQVLRRSGQNSWIATYVRL